MRFFTYPVQHRSYSGTAWRWATFEWPELLEPRRQVHLIAWDHLLQIFRRRRCPPQCCQLRCRCHRHLYKTSASGCDGCWFCRYQCHPCSAKISEFSFAFWPLLRETAVLKTATQNTYTSTKLFAFIKLIKLTCRPRKSPLDGWLGPGLDSSSPKGTPFRVSSDVDVVFARAPASRVSAAAVAVLHVDLGGVAALVGVSVSHHGQLVCPGGLSLAAVRRLGCRPVN